ncbi:hypothetical protein M141_2867 [Bacteroides fragilis str. S38L5]|nr:hypothetical protein M141_2867 [Bacteroides fragilis str. S38L5]EYB13899.1 hypothetical protein M140_2813 [Bacteroides fragilis str. S38L3]
MDFRRFFYIFNKWHQIVIPVLGIKTILGLNEKYKVTPLF